MLSRRAVNPLGFPCRSMFYNPLSFSTFLHKTFLSKESCLQYLRCCKTMYQLKQIQTQVYVLGLQQSRGILNKVLAFSADPSHGNLHYAEKIFSLVQDPCLFIYNVMIKAFAKTARFRKAIFLFGQLREGGLWPDNFTYPFVLKAVGCLGEFHDGAKVHGFVVKTGLDFDSYVCNSLIDMYAQLGQYEYIKQVFEEMPDRDRVSWNVTISGYVRCGKFQDAVNVFRLMQLESNEKPDEATIVSTLSACTALKILDLGEDIHDYVRSKFGYTIIIRNALLDMYAKCGCLSAARKIFDEMPEKNVLCWTSMVSGYINHGELNEARKLFEKSPTKDVVLWTAMINGYVQYNHFDEAMVLFKKMQIRGVRADKYTLVALLTGCSQLGALEQGKWIHECINEFGIKIDAVVGTALTEMYAKCGCVDKSLETFSMLRERDTASWTSIICGLATNGRTSKALKMFSEMKCFGINPDNITFIGVLSACTHGGLVEEGLKLFQSMREKYHIEPKLEHYTCMVDLLGRAGLLDEAEALIESIPNNSNESNVPLFGALLSACRIHGNINMGENIAKRLVEIESRDSSVHMLLANIYASANRWEDVTKVRRKMKDIGVRKLPGCSSIEVDGVIHEFLAGDASHPEMRAICFMLNSMVNPLLGLEESRGERENQGLNKL